MHNAVVTASTAQQFLRERDTDVPHDRTTPLLGVCTRELKTGARMFRSERPKGGHSPQVHELTMGVQNVGDAPVEYYSALKRKEVLTQAATQMNLENTLRGRSQAQRPCAVSADMRHQNR